MIVGFIIDGSTPQTVIIRGDGPSLAGFGLTGALANRVLTLSNATGTIATNTDWSKALVNGPAGTYGIVIQPQTAMSVPNGMARDLRIFDMANTWSRGVALPSPTSINNGSK